MQRLPELCSLWNQLHLVESAAPCGISCKRTNGLRDSMLPDLSAFGGCGSCLIACQACGENAVVLIRKGIAETRNQLVPHASFCNVRESLQALLHDRQRAAHRLPAWLQQWHRHALCYKTSSMQLRHIPRMCRSCQQDTKRTPCVTAQVCQIKQCVGGHSSRLSPLPAAFLVPRGGSCKFMGQAGGEHT